MRAIYEKQPIAILGDYDVDGISSTALLLKYFKKIGIQCYYTIPDRISEGYGLNEKNIEKYKDCLIIAVDCGSSSFEELKYARENGVDVVVIDHHTMTAVPEAVAVVNAHRPDESGGYKYLCAAGMVFMFIVGLNRALREKQFFTTMPEPDLVELIDLVAMATVCDVMPLVELNRAFVQLGLKVLKQKRNLGLTSLLSLSDRKEFTSSFLAFFLGPRINAAGRLSSPTISLKLLITEDLDEARELAIRLDDLNKDRQEMEAEISKEAQSFVDVSKNFVCVYGEDWHVGVIGIVAGRLKDKFNRPTIIISNDGNGIGRASCRSVAGVNISEVIKKGIEEGVILGGGGHEMAAGFSVEISKIEDLKNFFEREIVWEKKPVELCADCCLNADLISQKLVDAISVLEPFGEQNESPKFIVNNLFIKSTKILKEQHLAVNFVTNKGMSLRGIAFRCVGTPLGQTLRSYKKSVSVLGEISVSSWMGRTYLSLRVIDVATGAIYTTVTEENAVEM